MPDTVIGTNTPNPYQVLFDAVLDVVYNSPHSDPRDRGEPDDFDGLEALAGDITRYDTAEELREALREIGVDWENPEVYVPWAQANGARIRRDEHGWWVGAWNDYSEDFKTEADAAWAWLRSIVGVYDDEDADEEEE